MRREMRVGFGKDNWSKATKAYIGKGKGKAILVHAYYSSRGFQEVETPRFRDSRHTKVARLSALRAGRLCPPPSPQEIFIGTDFC